MQVSQQQAGLSLVELMVTVAIVSILSLAGLSFTGGWVNSNRVLDGQAVLQHAYSRSKAMAIRNEFGMTESRSAAAICFVDNVLSLHSASNLSQAACSGTQVWSATLPNSISMQIPGSDFSCMCLSNKASVTNQVEAGQDCSACATTNIVKVSAGGESADVVLL